MSRFYEEGRYEMDLRETKNGLSREAHDSEEWRKGDPIGERKWSDESPWPKPREPLYRSPPHHNGTQDAWKDLSRRADQDSLMNRYREANDLRERSKEHYRETRPSTEIMRDRPREANESIETAFVQKNHERSEELRDCPLKDFDQPNVVRDRFREISEPRYGSRDGNRDVYEVKEAWREVHPEASQRREIPRDYSREPFPTRIDSRQVCQFQEFVLKRRNVYVEGKSAKCQLAYLKGLTQESGQAEFLFSVSYTTDNITSLGATRDHREAPFYSVQLDGFSRPGSPGPVAGIGDIVNTEHGFTIQLDVRHFRPEEIKIVLTGDLLCVTGERVERPGPPTQTLKRSFSRKYCIPSDIRLNSISSHLTDSGFLIISGSRFGWRETHIMAHPPSYETYTAAQVPPSNVYNPNLMRGSHRGSIISQV